MEEAFDTNYAVLVRNCGGVYELRIPELLLVVRGGDLPEAYEELTARKRQIVAAARTLGMGDELPRAVRPALFAAAPRGRFGRTLSKLLWLRVRHSSGQ